jgi:hypothetical protein
VSDLSTDFDQKNTNHLQACFNPTSSRFQSPHHPCNHTVICLLMSVSSTKKIKKSGISPRNVKNLTQGCFVCIRSYKAWTYYRSLHFYTFVLWFMSVNRCPMSDADKCFDSKVFVYCNKWFRVSIITFFSISPMRSECLQILWKKRLS